jgi:DNA-binding NarL/FixJ family response regulator
MTRVYLADALPEERSALRLVLLDMNMEVVGEAADWPTMLANAPATRLDMLLVSWDLVPIDGSVQALEKLRVACSSVIVVVLISYLDARQQAALSAGADAFIQRSDMPERVALHLRLAAAKVQTI